MSGEKVGADHPIPYDAQQSGRSIGLRNLSAAHRLEQRPASSTNGNLDKYAIIANTIGAYEDAGLQSRRLASGYG